MQPFIVKTPKGERKIGPRNPAFIIAEMSANHRQDFNKAVEIVKAVAASGADAIKLQTYTPDTMTIPCDRKWFQVGGNDNPGFWEGKTLYELYETAYTPWEWQPELKKISESLGLTFFSTPFDSTSVDFLEKMGVALYKVGSYELTNLPLLQRIGETKKPVIMSIGYGSEEEIKEALQTLRDSGCPNVALLHCVTGYVTEMEWKYMHLRNFVDIRERFGTVSGFSENNGGIAIPVLAVAAGASLIEKHIILNKADGGPDAAFAIDIRELTDMVKHIRHAEEALGQVHYGPVNEKEEFNRDWCRESLFVVAPIKKGEKFSSSNVRVIRPGYGLPPKHYEEILEKTAAEDIELGTPLSWDLVVK